MNTEMPENQDKPENQSEDTPGGFGLDIGGATGRTSTQSSSSTADTDAENVDTQQINDRASSDTAGQSGPANSTTEAEEPTRQPPPRRPRSERAKSFDAAAWLVDGAMGIVEELRHNDLGLPAEFWSHAYTARREGLLAAQTLLSHLLERSEKETGADRKSSQRSRRRGSIQIE